MAAENNFVTDNIKTEEGDLAITFLGHATLMISFKGKIILDHLGAPARIDQMIKTDARDVPFFQQIENVIISGIFSINVNSHVYKTPFHI